MHTQGSTQHSTLTSRVLAELKNGILSGRLKPGERFSAGALAEEYGVSRTPVREALLELERLGLVVIEKNRGARVLSSSPATFLEIFQLRLMLEVPLAIRSAQLATEDSRRRVQAQYEEFQRAAEAGDPATMFSADRDFHTAVLSAAGNARALDVLYEQRNLVLDSGVSTVPATRSCMECFDEHRGIYEAYMAGDAARVGTELQYHLLHTAELLIEQEAQHRPEFRAVDSVGNLNWLLNL